MASRTRDHRDLDLDDLRLTQAWMIAFNARCRADKLVDDTTTKVYAKTDAFLARCGPKALSTLINLMPSVDIDTVPFKTIAEKINAYVAPKQRLVVAERTNFLQLTQKVSESEKDFLLRLNDGAEYCEWHKLPPASTQKELTKLRLIAGLQNQDLKVKILEKNQTKEMAAEEVVEFCQLYRQLQTFTGAESSTTPPTDTLYVDRPATRCGKCGTLHKTRECPAYGQTCRKCNKVNHFARCCRSSQSSTTKVRCGKPNKTERKATHNVDLNGECFNLSTPTGEAAFQTLTFGQTKLQFQVDTGATVSVMSDTQWRKLGSPSLRESYVNLTNFDGSTMATLGEYEATFSHQGNMKQAKFIVVSSPKHHGLLGRDLILAALKIFYLR